jgi:capsule polysaccharide export protein KpsE/RkpR
MENFNSSNIVGLMLKNIKTFVIVAIITGALAFAGSFAIKERFKSTAVVYPINMYETSEESTSEQLLQYFYSEDVKNTLAKEFKLYERYGIDTVKETGGRALFNYIYQENFKFSPTLYESIELSVTDTDPLMAQKLNAALIKHTNLLIRSNKQFTMRQYVVNAKEIIKSEDKELDSLSNEIKKIKEEYNIVDEEKQAKEIGKELAKGSSLNENMQKQANALKKKGSDLHVLKGRIRTTLKAMVDIKEQSYKYLLDSQGEVNFVLFVSNPSLADKRCYPVRSVIALVSILSALFLTSIILIIRNRKRG